MTGLGGPVYGRSLADAVALARAVHACRCVARYCGTTERQVRLWRCGKAAHEWPSTADGRALLLRNLREMAEERGCPCCDPTMREAWAATGGECFW